MNKKPKSGKETIDDFFSEITQIKGVDKEIAEILVNLYRDGKLTNTNISNELMRIREEI